MTLWSSLLILHSYLLLRGNILWIFSLIWSSSGNLIVCNGFLSFFNFVSFSWSQIWLPIFLFPDKFYQVIIDKNLANFPKKKVAHEKPWSRKHWYTHPSNVSLSYFETDDEIYVLTLEVFQPTWALCQKLWPVWYASERIRFRI